MNSGRQRVVARCRRCRRVIVRPVREPEPVVLDPPQAIGEGRVVHVQHVRAQLIDDDEDHERGFLVRVRRDRPTRRGEQQGEYECSSQHARKEASCARPRKA